MDKNINIDHKLIEYIFSHSNNLHPVQKELIKYNESLGHIKRLQISILQANFLQFLIKSRNINNCLEVGTFTGYSTLSMALSLNKNGKIQGAPSGESVPILVAGAMISSGGRAADPIEAPPHIPATINPSKTRPIALNNCMLLMKSLGCNSVHTGSTDAM